MTIDLVGASLTSDERRTYQSLIARGYDREDALEAALDGVHVHDVRKHARKGEG